MTNKINWNIDEASKSARKLLSHYSTCSLSGWSALIRQWRENKSALIAALSPETARREYACESALSAEQKIDRWCSALSSRAQETAADALYFARERASTAADDAQRAAADSSAERWRRFVYALAAARPHSLRLFSICRADFASDTLSASAKSLDCPKVRVGQSISRALAAWLRYHHAPECGYTLEDIPLIVDAYVTAAQTKQRKGTVVLSVNPLDLLCTSHGCAYRSCHAIDPEYGDGSHRAGNIEYIGDAHTVVAYYYEELRRAASLSAPFPRKLYRQLVYVDAERGAAAMQRIYGSAPDSVLLSVRRAVAQLLLRLQDKPDTDPKWKVGTDRGDANVHDAELAYVDSAKEYVSLDGGRPQIDFALPVCPSCGEQQHGSNWTPKNVCCDDCYRKYTCDGCGCSLGEEDRYSPCHDEDETYCRSCSSEIATEDAIELSGRYYCESCADERYPACCDCDRRISRDDIDDDGRCEDCHVEESPVCVCSECEEECDEEDLHTDPALDIAGECPTCVALQLRRVRFTVRLLRSPRYRRLALQDALDGTLGAYAFASSDTFLRVIDTWPQYFRTVHSIALAQLVSDYAVVE